MNKLYNILYKGNIIHTNLTMEDCSEILQDFSERFYSGEDIEPNDLKMEEIYG
jgi:NOL1/NOP2/fmu family ribosome biogenesis protein